MRWKRILVGMGMVFLLCFAYSFIEAYLIRVNEIDIVDEDVPSSFNGKTAVFVADIHCGPLLSVERTRDIIGMINDLEPDIILLGGDYIYDDIKYIDPCIGELKDLHAPLGVYGVLGNHEHWADAEQARKALEEADITLVDNQGEWITDNGNKIRVGGVGDIWEDTQDIQPTIENVSEEDFVILISHNPDYAEEIKTDKIDLMLAGHTHGGQVTFFGLWTPYKTSDYGEKYISGIVETEHTKVIITNGVGVTGLPIRFFAQPEIIHLKFKKT
ncbi:MAG: metallophosphoesterase [Candidatus Altiarchaeales archaeon]|nr:metallophosphoesterase [Candidatus Altiarchaeales archaeon]MBD3416448.1 metallophosphoesterase [Candidatus Altiarchaeales archaeon]